MPSPRPRPRQRPARKRRAPLGSAAPADHAARRVRHVQAEWHSAGSVRDLDALHPTTHHSRTAASRHDSKSQLSDWQVHVESRVNETERLAALTPGLQIRPSDPVARRT